MLPAPPEFNCPGIHIVEDAVKGLLLFRRWRILPVAFDGFNLPDYITDVGHT
jgi:hypothetical protein